MSGPAWLTADRPLAPWQRFAVALILAGFVVFGGVVEMRSAYLSRRMTDLGCYLRAAWAVRAGADPYAVTDDNGWHYNYPPFLAVLLVPLADAPGGVSRAGLVPYPVAVAIWYAANVGALFLAVHWLAGLADPSAGVGSCRWWAVRVVPVLAVLPFAGQSLSRGQVNCIVLLCLAGWLAGMCRGSSFRAGLWLAAAVCVKVIPAFLLVWPLWRRDGRCLAGCALGVTVGLVLVPAVACGPEQAWEQSATFWRVTLAPALGVGDDESRARELTCAGATDSLSVMSVLHNTQYPLYWRRPTAYAPWVRPAHAVIGLSLLVLVLGVSRTGGGPRPATDGGRELLPPALLLVLMAVLSPVCHTHYFVFSLPLVIALWTAAPSGRLLAVFVAHAAVNLAVLLPPLRICRELGVALYSTVILWGLGVCLCWRWPVRASG